MSITFYKYHGTGNDFILIDDRNELFPVENTDYVRRLCERRFGIGADGLMLLRNKQGYDFEMIYFNSDGKIGSMCGNGGRCIVAFAYETGAVKKRDMVFDAPDGRHEASISESGEVSLKMNDTGEVQKRGDDFILDTGSPHCVRFTTDDLTDAALMKAVEEVRLSDDYRREGINVNLVNDKKPGELIIRTYERGVENETFSCGTGVTAAAICAGFKSGTSGAAEYVIRAKGGKLKVNYLLNNGKAQNVCLIGAAAFVFKGELPNA